jgi:hypothetical protein
MKQRLLALFWIACAVAACEKKSEANLANFTKGMTAYLERRGDLCLGKNTWPIDVSESEAAAGTRDALQMPVLEKLGLVASSDATAERKTEDGAITVRVKRYQLTDAGKRNFLTRDRQGDFCAAKLSLDRVVRWETVHGPRPRPEVVVSYTYKVDAPAWTRDPEVAKVFPAVDRVVRGAGTDELKEGFTLTGKGWVANELLDVAP